ncbi:MAG: lipid-A-disaccharide synthase [Lewinellaceae bacterium]|nr:lipid-A-disaccharide synthase [Lewinella sp.]MCB9279166.1 lipid-A-disaccharide synthase [Lewinellaceae bacterium]
MKYFIVAGEASGDLHGSNLVKALRSQDPGAEICGWGGDLMEAAGARILKHYRDLAFMGFWEVITHLGAILRNFRICKRQILDFSPDAVILIDYPGFNLRLAPWIKAQGFKVNYYISPQLWAWKSGRVKIIKSSVDRLYVILPFEPEFYARYEYDADFVGHPLLDVVSDFKTDPRFRERNGLDPRPVIALLPGSRRQEISRILPVLLTLPAAFPDFQFAVGGAGAIPVAFYDEIIAQSGATGKVKLIHGATHQLLNIAHSAVVASGTASLETALFGVPEIVVYRGSGISFWIAKRLVHVSYISLANLILDRALLKELIQDDLNPDRLRMETRHLLTAEEQNRLKQGYAELREVLGQPGASQRTAEKIIGFLTGQSK